MSEYLLPTVKNWPCVWWRLKHNPAMRATTRIRFLRGAFSFVWFAGSAVWTWIATPAASVRAGAPLHLLRRVAGHSPAFLAAAGITVMRKGGEARAHRWRVPAVWLVAGLLGGCATVGEDPAAGWQGWFEPVDTEVRERYDQDRLEADRKVLLALLDEADHLARDTVQTRREVQFRPQPYLTPEQDQEIGLLLRRGLNLRHSLAQIAVYYRTAAGVDPMTQARGTVLGLSAAAGELAAGARLASAFVEGQAWRTAGNAAYPQYAVPAGTIEDMITEITHPSLERDAHLAYAVYGRALADPDSTLSRLSEGVPDYAELMIRAERAMDDGLVRVQYVTSTLGLLFPELDNQWRHSHIRQASEEAWQAIRQDADQVRGMVFKNVARIKQPDSPLTRFTPDHRQILLDQLEPGDILLTYTAGYMSNVFLPGAFKHGIVYCGTPPARAAAGLTESYLLEFASTDEQLRFLLASASQTDTRDGRAADVIEAVAEGVKFSSLERLLDTHVTRLLILRPRLDPTDRQYQLARTFARLGVPYDFRFDFSDPSQLCCTELVYRVLEGQGPFELPLSRTRGRWVLTADDLARAALDHSARPFEILCYAEPDPSRDDFQARLYYEEEAARRLRELLSAAE